MGLVRDINFSDEVTEYFEMKIKQFLDTNIKVDFKPVDTIPREASGKLRYFVSEIL